MFENLNAKSADILIGELAGTGPEGRCRKSIQRFRRDQTDDHRTEALALLNGLDGNVQTALKQALRI